MPRHQLDPHYNGALIEGKEWEFDLVHRTIHRSDEPCPTTRLVVPPELTAIESSPREGRLGGTEGALYQYRETTYHLTLKDRKIGHHKVMIALKGSDGATLLEAPVVWQRVEYLSSSPGRVTLGSRPVRVFLRCPDEEVELTEVLSAPEGIKAIVSSPREVTVMLDANSPGIIDGVIEVGTTAESRPPLRVPVVRYAPLPQS